MVNEVNVDFDLVCYG